jgi:hypothetical protein
LGLILITMRPLFNGVLKRAIHLKKLKKTTHGLKRLPSDYIGNPIPGIGHAVESENHHMGLGLAKLMELIDNYQGQLWLASGNKTLIVDGNGCRNFNKNKQNWQGVALACRFDTEKAKRYRSGNDDEVINSIIELLKGVEL